MTTENDELGIEIMPEFRGVLEMDNGSDQVQIDLGRAHNHIAHLVGDDSANKLMWEVTKFAGEVKKSLEDGIHLGSSSLKNAVDSLYYADKKGEQRDPKDFGLNTFTELKLAAALIASYVEPAKE